MGRRTTDDGEFPMPRRESGVQSRFEIIDTNWVSCNVNDNGGAECEVEGESYDIDQLEMMGGAPANVPVIPIGSPISEVDGKKHKDVEFMMDESYGYEGDGACVVFEAGEDSMMAGRRQMVCGTRSELSVYPYHASTEDEELANAIESEF